MFPLFAGWPLKLHAQNKQASNHNIKKDVLQTK